LNGILDLYNKEKEKRQILEKLLQGKLYELYLYYKDLASNYQANCISKNKIIKKIKELNKEYNKYKGEKGLEFSRTGLINSQIDVLKELLGETDE
jgi:hypothetical protein